MATLSNWKWTGAFVEIDKTYSQGGALVTELRKEGIRERVVDGYSMSDPLIKDVGDTLASVSALNGTQTTTLTPVSGVPTVDCDEETFTPIADGQTTIFIQKQKWVSWITL
jgi:hypothetical protein